MNKTTAIAISLILGTTLVSANSLSSGVAADMHIGASSATNKNSTIDESGVAYNIGFGVKKTFSTGIFIGGNVDYEYVDIGMNNLNDGAVYLDARAGYTYSSISVYGIGGMRALQGNGDFLGYGFGGGVEWKFAEHFAIDAQYKKYNMNGAIIDFDYTTAGGDIKYYF